MRVAVLFAALVALSCSNEGAAYETLRASGYKDIHISGWSPMSCGDSDGTCTGFEATGPTGQKVSGAVGCGYVFKGCTIRVLGVR
jgi:hypothetical protein